MQLVHKTSHIDRDFENIIARRTSRHLASLLQVHLWCSKKRWLLWNDRYTEYIEGMGGVVVVTPPTSPKVAGKCIEQ